MVDEHAHIKMAKRNKKIWVLVVKDILCEEDLTAKSHVSDTVGNPVCR